MNRKMLYENVRTFNLQDKLFKKYHCNFTNLSNEVLSKEINKVKQGSSCSKTAKSCECDKLKQTIKYLVDCLAKRNILLPSEIQHFNNL